MILANGTFITTGGATGLQAYIDLSSYEVAQAGNENYRIYKNGSVFTSQGVFVTTGGL